MLNRINSKMLSYHRNRNRYCCQTIQRFCLSSSISAHAVERRRVQHFNSHSKLQQSGSSGSSVLSPEQITPHKRPSIDPNKIAGSRAMFEYNLRENHLKDLPVAEGKNQEMDDRIFFLADVQTKALIVHGEETLRAMLRGETIRNREGQIIRPPGTILRQKLRPSDAFTIKGQFTKFYHKIFGGKNQENGEEENEQPNTPEQSNKVVRIAMTMNFIDFVAKASAAYLTSSKSLFAEAIHSSLDFLNQCILFFGNRLAIKKPNPDFPYGYGNAQHITTMFAGFSILFAGGGYSIYNGASGLYSHFLLGAPAELESLPMGILLLSFSFLLQSISLGKAKQEIDKRAKKEGLKFKQYLAIADPSLRLIFYEDLASLIGVTIALSAIGLIHLTGLTFLDSFGSIFIGGLLVRAAFTIIYTNILHLLNRSLPPEKKREIREYLAKDPIVRDMHDVKVTYHGPDEYRFKAEIDYNGREVTRKYLEEKCTKESLQRELEDLKKVEDLEEFLLNHGDKLIEKMGDEVDRVEQDLRREFPKIRHVDLESD